MAAVVEAAASLVASVVPLRGEAGAQAAPGIWRREGAVRVRGDAPASLYLAKNSPARPRLLPLPSPQKDGGI